MSKKKQLTYVERDVSWMYFNYRILLEAEKESVPLRLGMDVFSNGKLSELRVDSFKHTMKAYRQLMKAYEVKKYRACANIVLNKIQGMGKGAE